MKKLKFFFALALSACVMFASAQIQTVRTEQGKLINVGSFKKVITTDSTITTIDNIAVIDNTAGLVTVSVCGSDSLGNGYTSKIIYRYHKSAGTLTLAAGTNISAASVDAGLGTSVSTFTVVSNNLVLTVKGKLAGSAWRVWWSTRVEQSFSKF